MIGRFIKPSLQIILLSACAFHLTLSAQNGAEGGTAPSVVKSDVPRYADLSLQLLPVSSKLAAALDLRALDQRLAWQCFLRT